MFKYMERKYLYMRRIKAKKSFFGGKACLKEFLGFIRLKICVFVTCVALSGYLLFNPINGKIFFLVLTVFFASAAGYSLNQITDKKEDLLNNKRINRFASNPGGKMFVAGFFSLNMLFSVLLSLITALIIFSSVFLIAAYSILRVKEIFPLKNLYTALALSLCFLVGASAGGFVSFGMLMSYFVVSVFIFAASLISDLRDHKGDKQAGIMTIPAKLGYETGKSIVYFSLALFIASVFILGYKGFYLLLPFLLPAVFFLGKDKPAAAHHYLLMSFILLPFALLAIKTGWLVFVL